LPASPNQFGDKLRKEFGTQERAGVDPTMTRQKAEQLAARMKALLKKLKELEKEMQAAARDLAATDKDASSKIRRALGDMQQDELTRNMSLSAEMIRRGYGGCRSDAASR